MLRRIFVDYLVDDQRYPNLHEDIEEMLQSMEHSGMHLMDWAITDRNNSNPWTQYIGYLMNWAVAHSGVEYEGMTPACFDEWRDCEGEKADEVVMQFVMDGIRAEWINIGEGLSGDYDSEDPDDSPLLRFEIAIREHGQWAEVEDSSYCTQMSADAPYEILERALRYIHSEYASALRAHPYASVKKLGERLSWISSDDFREMIPHE